MAAANDGSEAEEARRQEELAKKLAQLSDEKRQKYEVHVYNAIDAHGTASHDYRLGLAKTFLQGLPPSEEGRQISDYNDRERKRAYADAQRLERAQTGRDQAAPEPTSGRQPEPAAPALDPMQGVRANGPQRDYGKLQKTQDEAAQRSQSPDPATAVLSRQQLQEMSERYAEVRKAGNLQLDASRASRTQRSGQEAFPDRGEDGSRPRHNRCATDATARAARSPASCRAGGRGGPLDRPAFAKSERARRRHL